MALDICHSILLHFVHFVLWLRLYLYTVLTRLLSKTIGKLSALCFYGRGSDKLTLERCRVDSKNFQKLPQHIGFQILEERISEDDVASVVLWCIAMGIPFVTLFDMKGHFKENPVLLARNLQEKMRRSSESDQQVFQVKCTGEKFCEIIHKESIQANDKTRIAVVSNGDGRRAVTDSARSICEEVADKHRPSSDIDIPLLEQRLSSAVRCYPDPDLVIQFGVMDCLLGFSPWTIRVTEIMSLPTHHGITYASFSDVLKYYSRTQQRFGK